MTNEESIRLGGPIFESYFDPDNWVNQIKKLGYSAAYSPVDTTEDDNVITEYAEAASENDIIIAEVGVWCNPISPNTEEQEAAFRKCVQHLQLADKIGANCCVNVSGSRNPDHWYGPHPDNLTNQTFDMIVNVTQKIIDEVKPGRTYFTLEPMPWAYPNSVESYQRLLKAIDRKRFAVHYDPVNIVNSPDRYYENADMIRDFFAKLGPKTRSCHAKDILLQPELTTHLDEVRPGLGGLDYVTLLEEIARFPQIPLMLEHLDNAREYELAAEYIRTTADRNGMQVR